jgi:hypothetical protein
VCVVVGSGWADDAVRLGGTMRMGVGRGGAVLHDLQSPTFHKEETMPDETFCPFPHDGACENCRLFVGKEAKEQHCIFVVICSELHLIRHELHNIEEGIDQWQHYCT